MYFNIIKIKYKENYLGTHQELVANQAHIIPNLT